MQVTTTTNTEFTDSWPCLKISWLHWKSGSSNLLVDTTYSIVALRTFVLAFLSNELLPKRKSFYQNRFTKEIVINIFYMKKISYACSKKSNFF